MITLIEQPAPLVLTRNPAILKIRATDANGQAYGPKAAGVRLTLTAAAFADGEQLSLQWTDAEGSQSSVAFTVVVNPTEAEQLPSRAGQSMIDYLQLLLDRFRAHPIVGSYFIIQSGNDFLEFRAIEAASGWLVEMTLLTTNASTTTLDYDSDNTPNEYRLLLDVFTETGYQTGQYRIINKADGLPDGDGYCTWDFSSALETGLQAGLPEPPLPSWGIQDIIPAGNTIRYALRYREDYQDIYTEMPIDGQWQTLPSQLAMSAGISQALFAESDFFSDIDASNSLLHWWPLGKTVAVDQPEYLAWYNYRGEASEIEVQLVTFTEAGQQDPSYPYAAQRYTVPTNEVALIPVSPTALGLGEDVLKYEIRVGWQNPNIVGGINDPANGVRFDIYSPFRSYYIDRNYYQSVRYLQYLNGFNIPETLRCVGEFDLDLTVQRSIVEKVLQPDYEATTAELEQYQETWSNQFTYRTGYLRKAEVDALQELAIRSQVWEVTEAGYIPLQLTAKKFSIDATSRTLHTMTLKCEPRLKPRNYSNGEIELQPNQAGWLTTGGGFWLLLSGRPWPIV